MGYWTYYVVWIALAAALRYPWLAAGALVFFVLRRFIPDPFVFVKTMGRIRSLRVQIEANPANVTARRDLARLYLDRLRPRAALKLVDEALARDPKNAELLYLRGLACSRVGRYTDALAPLVEAVQIDPRILFGEPYLLAGDALTKLGRDEEAEDAYERYVDANTSSVEGFLKLSRVRRRRANKPGARVALDEALSTFSQLPGFRRRKQLGWWLRAHVDRLFT